jgi:hypothetical protein
MHRRAPREPRWGRRVGLVLVLSSASLTAAEPRDAELRARLSCRREVSPGRVQCELEVAVARGRLAWADAVVVSVPEFAKPLRSRVGPEQALRRSERATTLPLALAATRSGRGELEVEARAVVCVARSNADCTPHTRVARAEVEVGAREQR